MKGATFSSNFKIIIYENNSINIKSIICYNVYYSISNISINNVFGYRLIDILDTDKHKDYQQTVSRDEQTCLLLTIIQVLVVIAVILFRAYV